MGGVVVQTAAYAAGESDLSADECRVQLDRILKSADFDATARGHRFLHYIVEETLSGSGGRIKAYSIAVEVFGRDASFDPQTDPIVRIEAGHLRRSLERYYLTAGQSDPVLITIPKGAYIPSFSSRPRPAAIEADPPASDIGEAAKPPRWRKAPWLTMVLAAFVAALAVGALGLAPNEFRPAAPEIPRLLVEKFEDLSGTEASAAIAGGLTQQVVGQLARFKDIVVIEKAEPDGTASPSRFALAGSVSLSADAFRLRVRLINRADGSVLWANSYDGGMDVGKFLDAETDIARKVATSLAQTYGVIFQTDAALHVDNPPDDWAAYSCMLSYHAYRADLDAKAYPAVRACLEQAVERFPNYATGWGLLSQTYIDGIRFRYPFDATSLASIERALAAARRAVGLDPLNVRGLQAEMLALYLSGEIDAALAVGKQAMAINPNDTELIGEYGYRLALSGNWSDGCPLVAEARERNPGPLTYYETALALCSYFSGDNPQAVMWISKATAPGNANYHAIAAAIFGEGGHTTDARREADWLRGNAPALIENAQQEISIRFARREDVDFFIGSLRKAGLDIPD
jgi:TolB-like protein